MITKEVNWVRRLSCPLLLILILQCSFLNFANAQGISLDSCLALARRNNADIRTSQLEIEKSHQVKQQVFTKYFPQVAFSGIGYTAASPLFEFGLDDIQSSDMRDLLEAIYEAFSEETDINNRLELMSHGVSASVMVGQPIFAGGRIVNGNKLASLGEEAAKLKAKVKMRDVLEEVESSYYLVVGLQEKEATVEAALALIDSLDRVVTSALNNGLATRTDALQVQLKRNEINAQRQKLTSGLRLARQLLCIQIGIPYTEDIAFGTENGEWRMENYPGAEANSQFSPLNSQSTRPESQLLDLNVRAQQLQKSLTVGAALPQLALVGTAYYGNLIRTYYSSNVIAALQLTVPLSAWWETSHKIKEHNIMIREAMIMQEDYNRKMSLETEKAYSDMVDAAMLIRSDSVACDLARENYRLANINYAAGANTLNDVLQAHTLLLRAQNSLTDRRISYLVARRRLQDLSF